MKKDIARFSASMIDREYWKALADIPNDKLIQAGRGMEKPSETRTKTDPLSLEWRQAQDYFNLIVQEIEARKRWHGCLKPIKPIKM